MTYRSAEDALRERTRNLEEEQSTLREARRDGAALDRDAKAIEKQLADAKTLLTRFEQKRALPMLDDVKIASPCSESWDAMKGDDKSRFCGKCEKNVYNLSAMTREEAELVMLEREGELCVRLYRRKDGTVLTQDCPVGVRRKRLRIVGALGVGAGLAATLVGFGAYRSLAAETQHPMVMGAMGVDEPPTPSADPVPPAMGTVAPPAPQPPPAPKPPVAPKPHAQVKR